MCRRGAGHLVSWDGGAVAARHGCYFVRMLIVYLLAITERWDLMSLAPQTVIEAVPDAVRLALPPVLAPQLTSHVQKAVRLGWSARGAAEFLVTSLTSGP